MANQRVKIESALLRCEHVDGSDQDEVVEENNQFFRVQKRIVQLKNCALVNPTEVLIGQEGLQNSQPVGAGARIPVVGAQLSMGTFQIEQVSGRQKINPESPTVQQDPALMGLIKQARRDRLKQDRQGVYDQLKTLAAQGGNATQEARLNTQLDQIRQPEESL